MNNSLLRQWAMLRHIPRHPRKIDPTGVKARLEAEGYEISLRSIQRDLNNLAEIFPLMADDAKPQGWSWQPQAPQLDLPTLNPQSALTFSLAQKYLQKLLPTSTLEFLQPWFQTANEVLNAHGNGLSKWPDKIRVLPRGPLLLPPTADFQVQSTIYDALLNEKQADICYRPRGAEEIKTYQIHPLAIVVMEQIVYLICTLRDYEDLRHLALHRIVSATLTDASISRPEAFDLDRYIAAGHFGLLP